MDRPWRFWWAGGSHQYQMGEADYTRLDVSFHFHGPGASGEVRGTFWHPVSVLLDDDALGMRRAIAEGLVQACGGKVVWPEG